MKAARLELTDDELAERYVAGIDAARAKVADRVGLDEADRWARRSIESVRFYVAGYRHAASSS